MTENNAQIKKVVTQLISVLNPRNREIISRRFGLKTGKKETLESIGAGYGITRERVRQIEEASLAQIRESLQGQGGAILNPFVVLTREVLDANGGVIQERELFARFSGTGLESPLNAALVFVLTLSGTFHRSLEDEDFEMFWSLSKDQTKRFREQVATLATSLEQRDSVMKGNEVPEGILSYLSISKNIGRNVFGEVGLTKWAQIKPRGVRDKSYLVLKKEAKPKHFREITQLINEANFGTRKAHVQTVHNELIKDDRFVLVGRGIYALSEWGYESGTVKEVIASLLRKEGKPLPKDQIIAHVMSSRMVKPNTVILGMQDKNLFEETIRGYIALKEA